MSTKGNINLGIIGLGNRGEHYLQRLDPNQDYADLAGYVDSVAIADVQPEVLNKLDNYNVEAEVGTYTSALDMLQQEELDLVIEATNEPRRVETLEPYLKAGIPVLSEKPLSEAVDSAEKLASLAEDNDVLTAVGLNMNLHPAWRQARQDLEKYDVNINEIYLRWLKNRGPRDHPLALGVLDDLPHLFGLINQIMEDEQSWISVNFLRKVPAVVDRNKYTALAGEEQDKLDLIESAEDYEENKLWYNLISTLSLTVAWDDQRQPRANINASYDQGKLIRDVVIGGDVGGQILDKDYFDDKITAEIDFAAEGEEIAYELRQGLQGGETRVGTGEVIKQLERKQLPADDLLDLQLEKMLNSVQQQELDKDLTSFFRALQGMKMLEEVKTALGKR